jgi:hypothetical protein
MKVFMVLVSKETTLTTTVVVKADSVEQAEELALVRVKRSQSIEWGLNHTETSEPFLEHGSDDVTELFD